jgi:hypothetical protein
MIIKGLNFLFSTPVLKSSIGENTGVVQHLLTKYGDANKKSANVSGDNILDDPFLRTFRDENVLPIFRAYCVHT